MGCQQGGAGRCSLKLHGLRVALLLGIGAIEVRLGLVSNTIAVMFLARRTGKAKPWTPWRRG